MVQMSMSTGEHRTPPYAPYRSWKGLLDKLKVEEPLPRRLDLSFWSRLKFSGSMIGVLKPTMVSLGLLTSDEEKPKVYSRLMDISYPDYHRQLDLSNVTDGELIQYFSSIGATAGTGRKARAFFLGLAKDAGKTLSSRVTTRTHRTVSQSRQGATKRKTAQTDGRDMVAPPGRRGGAVLEGDTASAQESLMLWGLFKRLPKPGSVFSPRDREAWLEAARTTFNLEYSETASTPSPLPERGAPPG
ncbi:MAG: hypothetical protein HW388_941 [Dehalococcoidia bacterium]|nr:hypothetical protein [Dehalococcoidia bacterium]